MSLRIKKNDLVQIISGKDKGKTGKLLKVSPCDLQVKVEKLFLVKRHKKPDQKNPQGGLVEKEMWISSSKVMPVCPKCNKGVRVRTQIKGNNLKVRICAKCEEVLGIK
ncbi:MAG: 50S ribosomal protein L24 [Deltaproteobacteria bacterium]|nr:50S ribosomal protein L24 [Deltaproteobacteria bacterium]